MGVNKVPHKHAELIKAWAEGAEVEYYSNRGGLWRSTVKPGWLDHYVYRIKPEPKPDIVLYGTVEEIDLCVLSNPELCRVQVHEFVGRYLTQEKTPMDRLKYTVCGTTGKIKSIEVL